MKAVKENKMLWLYLAIYFVTALTIALHQPLHDTFPVLCNPPDEHSRYLVPLYICNHGTLPTGFEEELFSGECRWTYGFYTLLPYMIQGYAMRFIRLFTDSALALLYTARMVNVLSGALMAYVVVLISRILFQDKRMQWIFCFLVMFLPQSLFMHTYVNPDSMCLLSTALMLYGLLRGYGDGFSVKSCSILASGVILCALSYYNAYGFILSSILLFTAYFVKKEEGRWHFEWGPFLKKGLAVSAVVLLCIGWSFIRNFLLYDGDIIGLATKENFIQSFGITRDTYQSRGESLIAMLFGTNFFETLGNSFIACYGSMSIMTWNIVYRMYKLLFLAGISGLVLCRRGTGQTLPGSRPQRWFFHANLIFCILMPFILLVQYAYTVDYQAQGRYILPGIIPIMFYVCYGLQKLAAYIKIKEKWKNVMAACLMWGIVTALLLTVFGRALPYYLQVQVL